MRSSTTILIGPFYLNGKPTGFAQSSEGTHSKIEHHGSTSVPGLPAKPVIDILLLVVDSADEPASVPQMEEAGYVPRIRERDWHEHRMFKGLDANINLHAFTEGCLEVERVLRFRDRPRSQDDDPDLYARTKRESATRDWKFIQDNADAKTQVIEEIIIRAKKNA